MPHVGLDAGAWRQLSAAVTARDGACVECGSTQDLHAHHDVGRAEGGPDAPENPRTLITLCAAWHGRLEGYLRGAGPGRPPARK